jgi:hypothetical protein
VLEGRRSAALDSAAGRWLKRRRLGVLGLGLGLRAGAKGSVSWWWRCAIIPLRYIALADIERIRLHAL